MRLIKHVLQGQPGVEVHMQAPLVTAALAALPFAAERDALYILRCLRACVTSMLASHAGKGLAANSWQMLQQSSMAPLATSVSRQNGASEPLVLIMAAACEQCLRLLKRMAAHSLSTGQCFNCDVQALNA